MCPSSPDLGACIQRSGQGISVRSRPARAKRVRCSCSSRLARFVKWAFWFEMLAEIAAAPVDAQQVLHRLQHHHLDINTITITITHRTVTWT